MTAPQDDSTTGASSIADYAPPDPYAKGLAALRAATETPAARFEREWKTNRLREFQEEWEER